MSAPPDRTDLFAQLARSLARHGTLDEILQDIVETAVHTVPGADYAAITRVRSRHEVSTVASTDPVCREVDRLQYETGQGPCLDAIREQEVVRVDDLSGTERWPAFASRAVHAGVRSMLALRLFLADDTLGALNLSSVRPEAFGEDSVHVGRVFASHATVAWVSAIESEGLQAAMASRTLIGQAQGILMAHRKVTAEVAFDLLRTSSQGRNVKLRVIAQEVVETGALLTAS